MKLENKSDVAKLVMHYIFVALLFIGTIVAYNHRIQIDEFFARDLTKYEVMNTILHYVPKVIKSVQIIMVAILINLIISLLAKLNFLLTNKAKTLMNIFVSLLKWIIIIGAFLVILSVWGVDTSTLMTGVGIVTLIIGLASQGLISDILAGMFIIFEGEYIVGDIVMIDGWRGTIKNIGIRTTQIEDIGGNVKIINNSSITSVVNMTRQQSLVNCYVHIDGEKTLSEVELLINENLEAINSTVPNTIGKIMYKGVTEITDNTIVLLYSVNCYEQDYYQVQRELNRAFRLFLEQHNISNFAPQAISDKTKRG